MEKLVAKTYKGIEYICLNELPSSQREKFSQWLRRDNIISIQINGNTQKNCVQYSDYCYWYDSVFSEKDLTTHKQGLVRKGKIGLAFDN